MGFMKKYRKLEPSSSKIHSPASFIFIKIFFIFYFVYSNPPYFTRNSFFLHNKIPNRQITTLTIPEVIKQKYILSEIIETSSTEYIIVGIGK